ncbi:MAG: AAA family ATPase [Gammaproteobacteria bacterium]
MSKIEYKGARFYKCALQVNPYTYARNYRGSVEQQNEQQYNADILEQCRRNGIEVVGLADHGRVKDSESLRMLLKENGIAVFPGFEISSSEKIHMVCLYPEDTGVEALTGHLAQLMDTNSSKIDAEPTHPSSLSCENIVSKIQEQGGFWYAAHATRDNGILRLSGRGDNYVHLWKKEELVVAIQIPCAVDELRNGDNYKQIIRNQNRAYRRVKPIAVINANDVESPVDLENPAASCRIKMTRPTFKAFRTAFLDPVSRIRLNHEIPETHYSVIESVQWQGDGFFASMGLAFSANLNAVIGGRGTGKSTLIESIRYALGRSGRAPEDKTLDNLRKNNMANSQIILKILSQKQQGQKYTISRRYGEQPIVKNAEGDISHLTPDDILPNVEILGQNEILEIEKNDAAKLALINSILPGSKQIDGQIGEVKDKLVKNRKKLTRASAELDRLESAIGMKAQLKERADQFKKLGVEKKLKNADLLEQENSIREKIQEQFGRVDTWLGDYEDVFDLGFFENSGISGLPNKDAIAEAREILAKLQVSADESVERVRGGKQSAVTAYETVKTKWDAASGKIKDQLYQAISQLPEQVGKSGRKLGQEYAEIVRQIARIERQEHEQRKQSALVAEIKRERKSLLDDYRQLAFSRFDATSNAAGKLNRTDLHGKVKIRLVRCGNVESLKKFFQGIHGIGQATLEWLDKSTEAVDLLQMVKWIKSEDTDALRKCYPGLTANIAGKLLTLNRQKEELLRLEEIELEDIVKIELNVSSKGNAEKYVQLEDLSTGQKCTAILNLLLLSNEDPLIVDQPEDHLDNAFIADRIVSDLRQLKTKRQFLFSTHNANIPVFGDAELIAVLHCNQPDNGEVLCQGSIDQNEVKEHAANILEGGEAAFSMRKSKYGF